MTHCCTPGDFSIKNGLGTLLLQRDELQKCVKNILWILFYCAFPKAAKQNVIVFLLYPPPPPFPPHIFQTDNMLFIATLNALETWVDGLASYNNSHGIEKAPRLLR